MDDYRDRLAAQLPEIRRTVRRLGGSYGLADDVTQECCVRILEKEGLWKGQQAEGWMGVISRNLALRLRGRAARMRTVEKPLESDPPTPDAAESFPEEKIRWVLSQFASLSPKQREVLKMRYFDNLSTSAIAEKMGVSEPTVATHHARALETLKGGARRAGWVVSLMAWLGTGGWKGKAAAAVAVAAAVGGTAYFFTTDPGTHLVAKSTELKRTVITPHLDCPVEAGKNVLYCATFQLAWNEFKALAGKDVFWRKPCAMADRLDAGVVGKGDLSPGSFVAMAGTLGGGIIDRINAELEKTFGQGKDPVLEGLSGPPDTRVAYAFLARDLPFRHPFDRLAPMGFGAGKESVAFFGFHYGGPGKSDMASQVLVYRGVGQADKGCVAVLESGQEGEEILLARVQPGKTLQETVQAALALRNASKGEKVNPGCTFKCPVLDFDLHHEYRELMGDRGLDAALQTVRFKLDEKGALLRSRSMLMWAAVGVDLVFDSPFLILLKKKDSAQPYFALWVDNAEVLVGEKAGEKKAP